jgi:hypothetical protein
MSALAPTAKRWRTYARANEAEARQAKVLKAHEARRIAMNIARLPELLGKGKSNKDSLELLTRQRSEFAGDQLVNGRSRLCAWPCLHAIHAFEAMSGGERETPAAGVSVEALLPYPYDLDQAPEQQSPRLRASTMQNQIHIARAHDHKVKCNYPPMEGRHPKLGHERTSGGSPRFPHALRA